MVTVVTESPRAPLLPCDTLNRHRVLWLPPLYRFMTARVVSGLPHKVQSSGQRKDYAITGTVSIASGDHPANHSEHGSRLHQRVASIASSLQRIRQIRPVLPWAHVHLSPFADVTGKSQHVSTRTLHPHADVWRGINTPGRVSQPRELPRQTAQRQSSEGKEECLAMPAALHIGPTSS